MLINTVLMFLRELLPVFLLATLLLVWHRSQWRSLVAVTAVPAAVLLVLISSKMVWISDQMDGLGLELLYSLLYVSCFSLLCLAAAKSKIALLCAALAAACLLSINGSNLVLYLWIAEQDDTDHTAVMLGAALGLGIGSSIAVLWYYLLTELKQWSSRAVQLMLALLGARQIMVATALLIQSDWLAAGAELWQSESWLPERSELGFFLQALVGYEATPTLSQAIAYSVSCLFLLWCSSGMEKIR